MALEDLTGSSKYISNLTATNPTSTDPKSEGDDHIRGVKNVLFNTFPNIAGIVTPDHAELSYVNGVTSPVQTQIDANAVTASAYTDTTVATLQALLLGMIAAFPVSTPPTGWLECDGSAIPGAHTALIALVGTNTPDLRGEFIRGWDNGKGTDSGRAVKSLQLDGFQDHWHKIKEGATSGGSKRKKSNGDGDNRDVSDTGGSSVDSINHTAVDITENVLGSAGTPRKEDETRPRNIALMYCIKHD